MIPGVTKQFEVCISPKSSSSCTIIDSTPAPDLAKLWSAKEGLTRRLRALRANRLLAAEQVRSPKPVSAFGGRCFKSEKMILDWLAHSGVANLSPPVEHRIPTRSWYYSAV